MGHRIWRALLLIFPETVSLFGADSTSYTWVTETIDLIYSCKRLWMTFFTATNYVMAISDWMILYLIVKTPIARVVLVDLLTSLVDVTHMELREDIINSLLNRWLCIILAHFLEMRYEQYWLRVSPTASLFYLLDPGRSSQEYACMNGLV